MPLDNVLLILKRNDFIGKYLRWALARHKGHAIRLRELAVMKREPVHLAGIARN